MVDLIARVRSLWRGVWRRSDVEAQMSDEFRHHIELRARDLERTGLSASAALMRARREFGSTALFQEEGRASRGLDRVDAVRFSWLDLKLGARMMVKYPGLTIIAGLGMAVAIAIGTGYTRTMQVLLDASLPLPDGDRIVALQNLDSRINRQVMPALHDFVTWRDELKSVEDLGAYRTVTRNLVGADGSAEPLTLAEMSAVGFRVAGVQPRLGRYLLDADEAAGSPPVVVIAHDVWTQRFASDPDILGRELQLGTRVHTVVGVMPEDFAFPINHHFWIPLHVDRNAYEHEEGPAVNVFGRLAPGATLESTHAELSVIDRRMAAALPQTHDRLKAEVHLYARPVADMDNKESQRAAMLIPLLTTLLLIVICVNVAILVYARTAVRRGEIVVRTALGASRTRVITQLFAESLVLALAAAVLGLAIAGYGLYRGTQVLSAFFGGRLPFWMDFSLTFTSVVNAVALAILAAVITGALPAIKATGPRLQSSLQQLSAGGGSLQLGKVWTVLIVAQVAVTVALLPVAVYQAGEMFRYGTVHPGFAADEYLASVVHMDPTDEAPFDTRYTERIEELVRRLGNGPGVAAVTFASSVPGKERYVRIEMETHRASGEDTIPADPSNTHTVRLGLVDASFFDVFEVGPVAGRLFTTADADTSATAAIVNQSFVQSFGDGNVVGRRIRDVSLREGYKYTFPHPGDVAVERWYEIVGVVPDFPTSMMPEQLEAKVYRVATPGRMYPATVSVHLRGVSAASVAPRLRQVAAGLDPALQVHNIRTLDDVYDRDQSALRLVALAIAIVTLSVLLLSSAGIYAMMSLAVTRRRREIGIRAALGANPRHILANVFARASAQLGAGIAVGLAITLLMSHFFLNDLFLKSPLLMSVVSAIIATVGLLASLGPARRGLRIQPTEALKQE